MMVLSQRRRQVAADRERERRPRSRQVARDVGAVVGQ
jgi:hypothetical protein